MCGLYLHRVKIKTAKTFPESDRMLLTYCKERNGPSSGSHVQSSESLQPTEEVTCSVHRMEYTSAGRSTHLLLHWIVFYQAQHIAFLTRICGMMSESIEEEEEYRTQTYKRHRCVNIWFTSVCSGCILLSPADS